MIQGQEHLFMKNPALFAPKARANPFQQLSAANKRPFQESYRG
jgi:hypothetical protein